MENPSGEKSDGLEIIYIGTMYKGSWDKKYWSSSRGKDRYPYPVGYHAVRTHIGTTYRMEIREGLKGPLFVITSTGGESCTGQTPDISWERFQKKGGPRVKLGNGKRFSCKIDGVELFGFRNPYVQRLLRELVANVNGTTERSLLSPSFCNEASRSEHEPQPPDSCAYPDLLPYLAKPHSTKKRSRKYKFTTINGVSGDGVKSLQTQDPSNDVEVAFTRVVNQRHYNEKKCLTSSTSEDDCQEHKAPGAVPIPGDVCTFADRENDPFSVEDGSLLESPKFASSLGEEAVHKLIAPEDSGLSSVANNLAKQEKHLDRSLSTDMQGCNSIVPTGDNKRESLSLIESKTVKDLDLCAPDTFDALQDSALESNKESPCHVKDDLAASNTLVSEEMVMDWHPDEELGTSTSNASSEKTEFDSVGQELAKSMMTLLLPQALPLLKKNSNKRQATILCSEISLGNVDHCLNFAGRKALEENDGFYYVKEVRSPDKLEVGIPVEGTSTEEEKMHILGTVLGSDILSSENVKFIIPDSFEDDQFENHLKIQRPSSSSSFVKSDQAPLDKKECNPDTLDFLCFVGDVGNDGNNEISYGEELVNLDENLEKDEILTTDSPLGCIFPNNQILLENNSTGVYMNLGGNNFCLETHSIVGNMDKELEIEPDSIKDIPAFDPTLLVPDQTCPSLRESMSNCEIPNFRSNESSNNSTNFQNAETAFSSKMVALCSKTTYFGQLVPSSSTKNLEPTSNEINKTKLAQYHSRHHSVDPKSQSIDIRWDQANPNTHGNQEDNKTCELSITRDANVLGSLSSVITQKEVEVKTEAISAGNASPFIQMPGIPPSVRKYKGPLSENIIFRKTLDGCIPETNFSRDSSFNAEIGQAGPLGSSLNKEVSFGSEVKHDGQHQGLNSENGILRPDGMLTSITSGAKAVVVHAAKDKDVSTFVHPSIPDVERHHVGASNEQFGHRDHIDCSDSLILFQDREKSFFNNNGHESDDILADLDMHLHMKSVTASGQDYRDLLSHEPNKESEGFVELLGCYVHPAPILSILLSTQGDDVHISVLCGLLEDTGRIIFIYKVPIKGQRGGCPSFLGYTSMMLPILKGAFCREIAFERSGLQFTPDGQYLVFPNSIKVPSCREKNIHCSCSICALECFEENAVKVVHVKLGYVSLVAKLKTIESVHCILVCEPSCLVAVEESGALHVWVMTPKWSACIEEFILPSLDYTVPCIVEIRKIPKCTFLIIGHNGYGDFGLWDISKRVIISRFSAPGNLVFQVLPVGIFRWEGKGIFPSSPNIKEQIKGIMAMTEKWFSGSSEDPAFLSSNGEDIAVWLLVSAACDSEAQYNHQANGVSTSPDGCWKLALLVKNTVIFGSVLDPRASFVDASMGHGIIGTRDGLIYMWELSTGMKLVDLHYFKGGHVSSIAADSKSGVLAVAGDENQLVVYVILSKGITLGLLGSSGLQPAKSLLWQKIAQVS